MKLSNVILYCKGWYKERQGGAKTMWMDMAHCIDADGWTVRTEHEVAEWCLRRLDNMREDPLFKNKSQLDLSVFLSDVQDKISYSKMYHNEEISLDTSIILIYRRIVYNCSGDCFDSGVKPNRNILPLNYYETWYDDGRYSNNPKLYLAEMDCDYQERVNELLSDLDDQVIDDNRFEIVEGYLKIKNINDVRVIVGTDSFIDCVEMKLKGKYIISGTLNETDIIERNIYSGAEIDPDKEYIVRATVEPFGLIKGSIYKIKSMKEV